MALKIDKIITPKRGRGEVGLEFKLDEIEDAYMAQEILRSLISSHLCVESSFGYNSSLEQELVFKYGCKNVVNQLFYDGNRYAHSLIKMVRKSKPY